MATESIELQHIADPVADLPQPRSIDAIERDVGDLERDNLTSITGDLDNARRRAWMHLSDMTEEGAAWRAAVDEYTPEIDQLEASVVTRLEAMRASLTADRDALNAAAYRPSLPAEQVAAAEAKAVTLRSRLASMRAADVSRALRGALLFSDPVEQAAWALVGSDIEARFPDGQRVRDEHGREVTPRTLFRGSLRQLERASGDRAAVVTQDRVEGQLQRLNGMITEITKARAAHDPSSELGSLLVRWQFGQRSGTGVDSASRRHDPAAVRARFGK